MPKGLARPLPGPLLLITDRTQAARPLEDIIEAALVAGCRWVSIREKDLSYEERITLVRDILPLVRAFGGTLVVHADIDAGAHVEGVHLPAGRDVQSTRRRLGDKALIGLSCHTLDDVRNALGADYVTLGPFAETKSKPGYAPTLTWDDLRAASRLGPPVLALGGIDATNVLAAKNAGAAGFALMGSVMRSDKPGDVVRDVLALWESEEHAELPRTRE